MLETALHSHLAGRGAVHSEERGVVLPRRFGADPAAEYAALREGAALVDLGFRTVVRATGADRVTFLHGMLSNDIASLGPGAGCPALLLTIQGRVTADLRVAALGDALLLDVDVRARAALVEALEKLIIADDVELREPGEPLALIGGEGPGAARLLPDAAGLAPYAPAAATLALEVPVEDAISATKGCYLGQEVVARGTARGHVNRRLVGLRLEGPEPPPGAPLVRDGKEAGRLTSVARAFGAGGLAALGFVRRECWKPGTELRVRHGHAVTLARVAELPLA